MLLNNLENFIQIKVYYIQKINKFGLSKIQIINEQNISKFQNIKTLNTKWKILNYKQAAKIKKKCRLKGWDQPTLIEIDVQGNQRHRQVFDYIKYNNILLKTCLIQWDLLDQLNNKVQCNSQNIDLLPKNVIYYLLNKYEQYFLQQQEDSGYLIKYMKDVLSGDKGISRNTPVYIKQSLIMSQLNQSLQTIKKMNDHQFHLYSIFAYQIFNQKKLTMIKSGKI